MSVRSQFLLRLCFVSFAAFCLAHPAFGLDRTIQQYVHTAWTQKEGAPTGILALAQTADGYLWIGGQAGLYRFDGASFERYRQDAVFSLFSLPNGDLWIGGIGSITLLRNAKETTYSAEAGVPNAKVTGLAADADGTIWATSSMGLARLEGDQWIRIAENWGYLGKHAIGMCLDRHGTFWVATEDTVVFLDRGSRRFRSTGISIGEVWSIVEAPNGKLWLVETTRSVRPMPLGNNLRPSDGAEIVTGSIGILFDREGALWISTIGSGMLRVAHPEKLEAHKYVGPNDTVETFTSKEGLTDDLVTSILEDREGNIWAGTNNGLDCFRKGVLVPVVTPFPLVRPVLLAGDGRDMWISSNMHIFSTQGMGKSVAEAHFYHKDIMQDGYRDPSGISWWSSNGLVSRFERGRPQPKKINGPFHAYPVLTEDNDGVLWGAVEYEGIFYLKKDNVWRRFPTPPEIGKLIPSVAFTDSTGRIWFGYGNGGAIVTLENGKLQVLGASGHSPVGFINTSIQGRGQHLWLGGDKLVYFAAGNFHEVLPYDTTSFRVRGIEETPDGSLWLAENRGVIHIHSAEVQSFLKDFSHRVQYDLFDSDDGLTGSFYDAQPTSTEVEGSDGRLWFAATKGVAWLDPTTIPKNNLPPPVSIRFLDANGKRYPASADLQLPPRLSNLEIAYTALSLSVPSRVRFRYRLEGVDDKWQEPGTRRKAFYTKLAPGRYHFRVIACNNDGVWNESGASLDFFVLPTYYQTIWFKCLLAIAAACLLYMAYAFRLRKATAEIGARLGERLQERERIARELHDTLLQDFQAIILRFDGVFRRLVNGDPNKLPMDEGLRYADKVLREGRNRIRDIRADTQVSQDLAKALAEYGNELSQLRSLAFDVKVTGTQTEINPIVRDEIYRIGREAIGNAFNHSDCSRIEIELTYDSGELQMRIRDDGKGIDPAILTAGGKPGHWGIDNMRERARKIGASLEFLSLPNAGTTLTLNLRLGSFKRSLASWFAWRPKKHSRA